MKKLFSFAVLAMGLAAIASCGNGKDNDAKVELNTELDTLAYSYGVYFGNQYSNFPDSGVVVPGEKLNLENFVAAFNAAVRRDTTNLKISVADAEAFLQQFQDKMRQKMMEEAEAKKAANKTAGAAFMAENAKKEGVTVLPSGLQIETVKAGTGKQPKADSKVKVNYKGTLIDGTLFDQGEGIEFAVGGVVKGFAEGLQNMKEGGKAILTMPSDLAYGEYGAGPMIEGGATLQFEVELLEVLAK